MGILPVLQFVLAAAVGACSLALFLYSTGRLSGIASEEVKGKLRELTAAIESITEKLVDFDTELDKAREQMSERWSGVQGIVGTIQLLQQGGQQLRAEVSRLQEQVADLRVDMARLQGMQGERRDNRLRGT